MIRIITIGVFLLLLVGCGKLANVLADRFEDVCKLPASMMRVGGNSAEFLEEETTKMMEMESETPAESTPEKP